MSINVNDKNIGHATAYAYYKAGGGTMTEAEFTEFMADFGTASQTAVEAAQAALASKNAAQTAATTATTKASEATTAAQTATTKAGEAFTSASTATSAKDTAVSAASTATSKATEATTAAATATSAATTATTAKDDAVSAKTAAQTAQTGAETAAASVSASAAQIQTNADDISELKEDLSSVGVAVEHADNSASDWMQGYWGIADGIAQSSLTWVMSNGNIGQDVLSIRTTNDYLMYLLAYDGDTYIGTWSLSEFTKTYNPTYGLTDINLHDFRKAYPSYEYRISAQRKVSANLTPSDFAAVTTVYRSRIRRVSDDIAVIYGDVADPNLWEYGIIKEDGTNIIYYGNNYKTRIRTAKYLRPVVPITITPANDYVLSATVYTADGVFESQSIEFQNAPYTMSNPNKLYRIVVKHKNETEISLHNIAQYISVGVCVNTSAERLLAEVASVKAVNHRGFNTIAPENTLPAFELSGKLGFKYVETDVAFTSDSVPVLMHDSTINRTARNADGTALTSDVNIADITYEQALEYDYGIWKGSQYAGTKIPTFEEFIHCCKAYNIHPWIELKQVYTAEQVALLISIIKKYGMEEHVSFISFSATALEFVKTQWDSVELGYNGTVSNANNLKTGKNRVFMIYELGNDCSAAVNAGYQVCFFGINRVGQFPNMNTDAYDSILTNVLLPSQITDATRYGYTG